MLLLSLLLWALCVLQEALDTSDVPYGYTLFVGMCFNGGDRVARTFTDCIDTCNQIGSTCLGCGCNSGDICHMGLPMSTKLLCLDGALYYKQVDKQFEQKNAVAADSLQVPWAAENFPIVGARLTMTEPTLCYAEPRSNAALNGQNIEVGETVTLLTGLTVSMDATIWGSIQACWIIVGSMDPPTLWFVEEAKTAKDVALPHYIFVAGVEGSGHFFLTVAMQAWVKKQRHLATPWWSPNVFLTPDGTPDVGAGKLWFMQKGCDTPMLACHPENNASVLRHRLQKLYGSSDVVFWGDSFPEGTPHDVLRHVDLAAFAAMPKSEKTVIFLRRNMSLAIHSSLKRFATTPGRMTQNITDPAFDDFGNLHRELVKMDTSAMILETYYRAICQGNAVDTRCIDVSYNDLCAGDAHSWGSVLLAFRANRYFTHTYLAGAQAVLSARKLVVHDETFDPHEWQYRFCKRTHAYNPKVLSYVVGFFGSRAAALYPHVGE